MFIPLSKIDEEKRLVIGRAVQEVVDKTGEIIDYATAKPAFEKWSSDFERMSGGLSKGNVRVMHNPKIVAGKVTDLSYNDADKAIDVVVKVVDDNEWKKVVEGVYTGFSVGGGYGRKWKDEGTGATRYTPIVSELSLVDNPCIQTCRIAELHKADGAIQELHLHGRARGFTEIYRPTRSFTEVMLKKGIANAGGKAGRWVGGLIARSGKKANFAAYEGAAARKYQNIRGSLDPKRYPANYQNYRSLRRREGGRGHDSVEFMINRAGEKAVAGRAAGFQARGHRIGRNAARYGIGAVAGGTAVALSEAQRRQRSDAGKASAEKRHRGATD